MPQNFSGQNLRGRNFKGQDLTGADFSHAHIQSANFTKAILKGANFSHAKAGLQRRQAIFLVAVPFFIATLLGVVAGIGGFATANFMLADNIKPYFIPAASTLIVLFIPSILILQQGYAKAREVWNSKSEDNTVFSLSLMIAILGMVSLVFAIVLNLSKNHESAVVLVIFSILSLIVSALSFVALAGVGEIAIFLAIAVALAVPVTVFGAIALVGVRNGFLNTALAIEIGGVIVVFIGFLAIYIGIKARSGYYLFSYIRMIVVNFAALGGTSFRGANLTNANFSHSLLKSTDFREANLTNTYFRHSKKLHQSRQENPNYSMLSNPPVRDLLVTGKKSQRGSYEGANLRGAYLEGADLNYANLRGADLTGANLQGACLEWAILTQAQAIGTDFTNARMTGACVEAWNIENSTKLDNVDCRFVYLLENFKPGTDDRERRPSSGEFKPGEFTKLFEEVLNTVDLIFRNGVDWKAFVAAFTKVELENEETELTIQGIENKGDGVFVIKVSVPPDTNKEKIHSEFTENYLLALEALEAKYIVELKEVELKGKDDQIVIYRQQNADMWLMINKLAHKPVTIEVKAIADSKSMHQSHDQSRKIEMSGGTINANGAGAFSLGDIISDTIGNTINPLPDSSEPDKPEIKELLTELQAAIKSETNLSDEDRDEALEQLKTLAEASENPQEASTQKSAKTAMKILKGTVASLPSVATLAEACTKLLPIIAKFLGLPI
jgi:uncharacterized protein YjbI with pentapeptide repeats